MSGISFTRYTHTRILEAIKQQVLQHDHTNIISNDSIRKLLTKNKDCPLTLEPIKENDFYIECNRCNYCFSEDAIRHHLRINSECPMCREKWNFPLAKYCNS